MKKILWCVLTLLVFSVFASAVTFKVDCDRPGPMGKISTYLKLLNPGVPNTLTISGTCRENIQIVSFDRLVLIAAPGAVLQDASDGQQPVVAITDSQHIAVQGFTIVGGSTGITCNNGSFCRLNSNTITSASGTGIEVDFSEARLWNDNLQSNGGNGVVIDGSRVTAAKLTVQGTAGSGVTVSDNSYLAADGLDVENNQASGFFVDGNSYVNLLNGTIAHNAYDGITLLTGSSMRTYQLTVSNNNGAGLYIDGLAIADLNGGGSFTGNAVQDISCGSQQGIAYHLEMVSYGTTSCNSTTAMRAARP